MIDTNNLYYIKQVSSGRVLDAYTAGNDFSAVTRMPHINDTTQAWKFTQVGVVLTLQQESTGRFLDAYQTEENDFAVVTREAQNNDTQRWLSIPVGPFSCRLRQLSTGRYLDAYQSANHDFAAVTRPFQKDDDSQIWTSSYLSPVYKQESSERYLDAYQSANHDFTVITRPAEGNSTQRWIGHRVGTIYTIKQVGSDRFLDAYTKKNDFAAVTRDAQDNDTQQWIATKVTTEGPQLLPPGGNPQTHIYTLQQVTTKRYLDAYQSSGKDFAVVTRGKQNNDSQRWDIRQYVPVT